MVYTDSTVEASVSPLDKAKLLVGKTTMSRPFEEYLKDRLDSLEQIPFLIPRSITDKLTLRFLAAEDVFVTNNPVQFYHRVKDVHNNHKKRQIKLISPSSGLIEGDRASIHLLFFDVDEPCVAIVADKAIIIYDPNHSDIIYDPLMTHSN